jgi:formylglycine-generating enzyme required for sulfatase activity
MKQLQIIITLLIGLLLVAPAHANDDRNLAVNQVNNAVSEKRIALVIGNSAYTNTPLKNPVNDARDMANKLRKLGFDVIERNNLQTRQIGGTLREFRSKLAPGAVALVFYAGHGLQIKGDNYLPAIDADINSEEDVPNQSLAVKQIMDVLDEAKTRLNLVFLDACRNNPYASRGFRSTERGLARVSAPSGTLISYATKPGSVAADGDGRNGLYTSKLLAQMDSNQQVEQTLKRVVSEVKAASRGKQEPWMEGSIEGDFCFAGCQVASLEAVPLPAPTHVRSKEEIEQESWDSARDSNDIDAVKEYLKQYPKGRFAGQAKILIATLKKSANKPAQTAEPIPTPAGNDSEGALWTEAQKGNSKEDYQAYLDQYPKGKYVALAKVRIKKLQDEAQAAAEQQEQEAWQAAQDENSDESYGRYLKGYPNGRYAGLAKARQEKLKNDQAAKDEAELWKKADSNNDKQAVEAYLNKYPSGRYISAASAKLKAIKEEEAKGPAMVRIPGRNYEIGKYDVTRGEFAKFVSETGYDAGNQCSVWDGSKWDYRSGSNWRNPGFSQDDTHPVTCVNWNDAQAYVSWLSKKTGRQYHLPSEAEWEYACYGGNQTEYCGGSDINSVAWYKDNSGSQTHPVGQKQANGYGLYDMSGNVWQWMENKYDNEHEWRALRGGSWNDEPQFVRAAFRYCYEPSKRIFNLGFRLARTLP